jgi:hypothetical protein
MATAEASLTELKLPSLRIGNLEIGFPAVQAALSGYSDAAMRIIAAYTWPTKNILSAGS